MAATLYAGIDAEGWFGFPERSLVGTKDAKDLMRIVKEQLDSLKRKPTEEEIDRITTHIGVEVRRQARDIISSHWLAISTIADALLVKRTLTRAEFLQLFAKGIEAQP